MRAAFMKTEYVIQIHSKNSRGWVEAVRGFETREEAEQDLASNRKEYEDGGRNEVRIVKEETE